MHLRGNANDDVAYAYDCYYSSGWKSTSANANFLWAKDSNNLTLYSNTGTAAGSAISWGTVPLTIAKGGTITTQTIVPYADATYSLGSSSLRWNDISLKNILGVNLYDTAKGFKQAIHGDDIPADANYILPYISGGGTIGVYNQATATVTSGGCIAHSFIVKLQKSGQMVTCRLKDNSASSNTVATNYVPYTVAFLNWHTNVAYFISFLGIDYIRK